MLSIQPLNADEAGDKLPSLIELLRDAVESGASVGFMPPLPAGDAWDYWFSVIGSVERGTRVLLVASMDGEVAGSVQLALETRANGAHRAEVQKLMVHRRFRQQGVGRALMDAVEQAAQHMGRKLLVLDTRQGDTADALYRKLGYTEAGVIPGYALDAAGIPHGTVIFYKQLDE